MYRVIWLISHIVLGSELCDSKEHVGQCFECHLDTTFCFSKFTSIICFALFPLFYCFYQVEPMIIKSVETDDDIRKKLPQYTKNIGSLDFKGRYVVFERMLSRVLTRVVFYLDYFLLETVSLSITSAFIWFLPKFSRHFAPLLFGWRFLRLCPSPSQSPQSSIAKPLVSRLQLTQFWL